MMLLSDGSTVEKQVLDLVKKHNLVFKKTLLSKWATDVTRLADDELQLAPIECLIVLLAQKKIISQSEAVIFQVQYLKENHHV